MSMKDFYGFISKKCIDEKLLETAIIDFFFAERQYKKTGNK